MFEKGEVRSLEDRTDLVIAEVEVGGESIRAVGFPAMLGPVRPGDRVVVNTTGVRLHLGTGGVGFLLWNLDGAGPAPEAPGHVMKLRYTPWQMPVLAAEAPESPHHEALKQVRSVDGMPVVACGLHSQIAGVVAGIRAGAPGARIGYLMTDGGALPLAWSDLVRSLLDRGLIDVTATSGHAFGGDLEAINVFSGLAALKHAAGADVVVAGMGPGVAGTATGLGFTGIEQGQLLDAATALGGRSIACVRLGFADERARHRGISHHTLTALGLAARERATVVLPGLDGERASLVAAQLREAGIDSRHEVLVADGRPGLDLLRR
ncbi:MAG: DUF3866 family protein, partial [Actinomycetota bacterium]